MVTAENLPAVLGGAAALVAAFGGWGIIAGRREKKAEVGPGLSGNDLNTITSIGAEVRELKREALRELERASDERRALSSDIRAMRETMHGLRNDHMAIMSAIRMNGRNGTRD